jgi:phosphate starvation-inducible PhoH-like protein
MPKNSIPFSNPDDLRSLFGPRDKYLKQICERLNIDVLVRGDQLLLQGEAALQVDKGTKVIQEMIQQVGKTGPLNDNQVELILSTHMGQINQTDIDSLSITLSIPSKRIAPKTAGQANYMRTMKENDIVFCTGPAGSGKTYLAVAMALDALRKERVRKICLVRPAVEAGEKLGFLPGDLQEKVNPYLRPLLDAMREMVDLEQFQRYIRDEVIEILPLAFMRGRTLNQTFMILDEAQNTTITQMKMFLTRMGQGSRVVVTGDLTQNDLPPDIVSGLPDAIDRLQNIPGIKTTHLEANDIVRHALVRAIVNAYDGPGALPVPQKQNPFSRPRIMRVPQEPVVPPDSK